MAGIATGTNPIVMQPAKVGDTVIATCKVCEQNFAYTQKRKGRRRKFCSAPCKAEWTRAWCIVDRVANSEAYKAKTNAYNAARREAAPLRTWECKFCGDKFESRSLHARRSCSIACTRALSLRANSKPGGVAAATRRRHLREKNRRRRMWFQGAAASEKYSRLEIFERDGWRCKLCGGDIDRAAKAPERKSASIDHIVPVSRGGGDTRANVQAAHYGCNSRKQNRLLNG